MSGGKFAERRETSCVALDRDNATCTRREQCPRQTAGTGADLDDCGMIEPSSGAGDSAREIEVEEEILPEAPARNDAVSRDHLAQRWRRPSARIADQPPIRRTQLAADRLAAISAANRNAAIRLSARAVPRPAIANAVP